MRRVCAVRGLPGRLADYRDCPGSPGMSTPPSPFGAADRTLIRANPRPSVAQCLAFSCLQNRLNELGQNIAIEIREW